MNVILLKEALKQRRFDSRDAALCLAADALLPVTGFVVAIYLTRTLGPNQYGLYSMLFTIVLSTKFVISSLCNQAAIKKIAMEPDWSSVASEVMRIYCVLGLLFSLGLFLASPLFAVILQLPEATPLLRLYAAEILFFSVAAPHRLVFIARGLFSLKALLDSVFWVGRMLLILVLVASGLSIHGAILGNILALVGELLAARYLLPIPFRLTRRVDLGPLVRLALPLMVYEFCFAIILRSDLFLFRFFGGERDSLGHYAAAQMVASLPLYLSVSLSAMVLSTATKLAYEGETAAFKDLAQQLIKILLWLLPLCSIVAGSAASLLHLLFGPTYTEAAGILFVLCYLPAPVLLARTAANLLIAHNYSAIPARLLLPVLPLTILMSALLIPDHGAVGAAWSIVGSFSVTAAGFLYVLRRVRIIHLKIVDLLTVVALSGGLLLLSARWQTNGLGVIFECLSLGVLLVLALYVTRQIGEKELTLLRSAIGKRYA